MKVKELIKLLQKCNQDADVCAAELNFHDVTYEFCGDFSVTERDNYVLIGVDEQDAKHFFD